MTSKQSVETAGGIDTAGLPIEDTFTLTASTDKADDSTDGLGSSRWFVLLAAGSGLLVRGRRGKQGVTLVNDQAIWRN